MFDKISQDQALQYAKNLRGAKASFQWSVIWAVGQTLHGNADGLYQIMRAGGLLASDKGVMTKLADGRQLWAYLSASQKAGGCGLSKIIEWVELENKFKMCQGWKAEADKLDMVTLVETLTGTKWYQFERNGAMAAGKFDLDKALKTLITRAAKAGVSDNDIVKAFEKLRGDVAARPEVVPESTPDDKTSGKDSAVGLSLVVSEQDGSDKVVTMDNLDEELFAALRAVA